GYVTDDELLALYRRAALLVLPSLYEGFGFPLIEAMACGTPCIASDDPALVEVSGGAALHFPRGDAGALRVLLRRVLEGNGALRQELSAKGLARAREFRWDRSAALHGEVDREAARGRSPSCTTGSPDVRTDHRAPPHPGELPRPPPEARLSALPAALSRRHRELRSVHVRPGGFHQPRGGQGLQAGEACRPRRVHPHADALRLGPVRRL